MTRPSLPHATQCLDNPYAHCMRVVGFDRLNRPIIYTCFGQANDRFDPEGAVKHGTCVLEEATRLMDEMNRAGLNAKHVEQWVCIADFEGFSLKDCSPKLINATRQVRGPHCIICSQRQTANDHYTERLGVSINIDAPWIFTGD